MNTLVYQGTEIHERGEMLSLTDMWRASGSPKNKDPRQWVRKEGAEFIKEFRDRFLNVPEGHILEARVGRNGGTFAHWQIALAYAKYLSPQFHIWCNEVVRAHMEGTPAPIRPSPPAGPVVTMSQMREYRLLMKLHHDLFKDTGLERNQAALAAAQATEKLTGLNPLKLADQIKLPAANDTSADAVPTTLGLLVEERTGRKRVARRVNLDLTELGLQTAHRDNKNQLFYEPTPDGVSLGAIFKDTGKKHGDGKPVKQLHWPAETADAIVQAINDGKLPA